MAGARVQVAGLNDFEVRRELIRLGATTKLGRLDALCLTFGTIDVTLDDWRRAAKFWALVRRAGLPTAAPEELDCDVVLAAVAATLAEQGNRVTIATGNARHFRRFPGLDAREWADIAD